MAISSYPSGVKVYLDDEDITKYIFGEDVITLTDAKRIWRNIDLTTYLKYPGLHKLRITAIDGVGRVDAKISIR